MSARTSGESALKSPLDDVLPPLDCPDPDPDDDDDDDDDELFDEDECLDPTTPPTTPPTMAPMITKAATPATIHAIFLFLRNSLLNHALFSCTGAISCSLGPSYAVF
jgi:hypothetical protein